MGPGNYRNMIIREWKFLLSEEYVLPSDLSTRIFLTNALLPPGFNSKEEADSIKKTCMEFGLHYAMGIFSPATLLLII